MIEETIEGIEEVTGGQGLFVSTGFSTIAVIRNGVMRTMKIPITTLGVEQVKKEMGTCAPVPPVITRPMTDKERDAMGEGDENAEIRTYDLTDEKYREDLIDYGSEAIWRCAIQGMKIRYAGREAKDVPFDEKRKLLEANGLTNKHILKIYNDIHNLNLAESRTEGPQEADGDEQAEAIG